MRSGAGGVVLGIVNGFDRMGLARMPLAPACWKDVRPHLGVEKNNSSVGTPRAAEPDARSARCRGQRAVVEDKAAIFGGIVFGLGGEKSFGVGSAVNLAVVKNGFAVPENEVDVALNVAVSKVLAGGGGGLAIGRANSAASVERVLVAEEANVAEDGLIGSDQHGERLRADRHLGVSGVPVV